MKDTDATVEVAVEYQLQEYKQVLRELYPIYLATTGKKPNRLLPWNWPIVEEFLFAVVAPIVFFTKKRRVGDCVFTFSAAGFPEQATVALAPRSGATSKSFTSFLRRISSR